MKCPTRGSLSGLWFLGIVLLGFALSATVEVRGQAAGGTLEGYVYDPQGAVVEGAAVRLVNRDIGVARDLRTDARGYYLAPNLPVGTYEITVRKQGFADWHRLGILLAVGDQLRIDATLELRVIRAEVVVDEPTPMLEPSRTGASSAIAEEEIQELPVNNRNWIELALLDSSVQDDPSCDVCDAPVAINVNGMEGVFNNIQVDGADNNNAFFGEIRGRTRAPFQFSQETVREFRVLHRTYSAEFGRASGGVINSITKSGTNRLRGSAFWYLRDNALSATHPFVKAVGLPEPDTRRQQFGFTLGGPLRKDRLFFFFSWDQQRRRDPVTVLLTQSIRSELAFNPLQFFELCVDAPLGDPCRTSSNSFLDAADGTTSRTIGAPFTSAEAAIIHQAFLNWVFARAYFLGDTSLYGATYPTPASPAGLEPINPFPGRSYQSIQRTWGRFPNQITFFPKITWQINPNHRADFSLNYQDYQAGPNGFFTLPTKTDNFTADGTEKNRSRSLIASLSSVLRPTLLNEFRVQLVRDDADTSSNAPTLPEIDFDGFDWGAQGSLPRFNHEDRWQLQDHLTLLAGRHQLKWGFDLIRTRHDNFFPNDFNGDLTFDGAGALLELSRAFVADTVGATAGQNYFGIDLSTGQGPRPPTEPRFLLFNYQQRFGRSRSQQTTVDYAAYLQDSIRLRPSFTLYLGVRYEFQQLQDPIFPNLFVPQSSQINEDENNVAPRAGLAWQLAGKVVLRAGYGIFHLRTAQLQVSNALTNNNAFSFNQFLTASEAQALGLLAWNPAALDPLNPDPAAIPHLAAPTTACPDPARCADPFASVSFFDPNRQNGYAQQASLELQWEITRGTLFTLAYLHTHGTQLPRNRNLNLSSREFALTHARSFTFDNPAGGPPLVVSVPDYRANLVIGGVRLNVADGRFNRLLANESAADSFYHALAVRLRRHPRRGLSFGLSYTFAKNIDEITNGLSSGGTFFSDLFDQHDARSDRGLSRLHQRHAFVARGTWEPRWWRRSKGLRGKLLDGWSIAVIYKAASGRAITPVVDDDINNDNVTTAFGDGDRVPFLARGAFTGPGYNNLDSSLTKRFRWGERNSLQLRLQVFNTLNRTILTRVDDRMYRLRGTTASLNPSFLKPEGIARRARDMQLGVVFRF